MIETMHAAPGIGLAANQVGVSRRVCVVDLSVGEKASDLHVFINPRIVETSGSEVAEEGCLSFPDIHLDIERPFSATVEAEDLEGKTFTICGDRTSGSRDAARDRAPRGARLPAEPVAVEARAAEAPDQEADQGGRLDGRPHWLAGSVRVVFLGTPDTAVPALGAIVAAGHDVPLVVTQPDRPVGRSKTPQATPVKIAAAAAAST